MQKTKNLLAIGLSCLTLLSSTSLVACRGQEENKHTHQYVETVIPATCTTKGYTEYKCSCGDSYKDNEQELIPHSGQYKCTTCQIDFGEKFKNIILENANDYEFIIVTSNYTQKIYTNDTYEIVMSFDSSVASSAYTVFLSYSAFNEKWNWLLEWEEKYAYGEFKSLSSASISLPVSYSDFKTSPASMMFSIFSPMVFNANKKLEMYNAGFTMENLGLKF